MEINELLKEVLTGEKRAEEIVAEGRENAREILLKAESEYPRQADCHITIS